MLAPPSRCRLGSSVGFEFERPNSAAVVSPSAQTDDDCRVSDPSTAPSARVPRMPNPNSVVISAPSPRRNVPGPAITGRVEVDVRHALDVGRRGACRDPDPAIPRCINPLPLRIGVHPVRLGRSLLRSGGWSVLSGARRRGRSLHLVLGHSCGRRGGWPRRNRPRWWRSWWRRDGRRRLRVHVRCTARHDNGEERPGEYGAKRRRPGIPSREWFVASGFRGNCHRGHVRRLVLSHVRDGRTRVSIP